MSRYTEIKKATVEVVGVRVLTKANTTGAHAAIRDVIVANPALSYQRIADVMGCSRWLVYKVAVEFDIRRTRGAGSPARRKVEAMRRRKYLDWEQAFHFIWENADRDGIWLGDAASLGEEFDVSEEAAQTVLDDLCDRRLIEKLYTRTYFISKWRERDEIEEREP